VAVLQLDPNVERHVELFREIRLLALRTDPGAFGSDHARESAFRDADWVSRLAGFGEHPGTVFAIDSSPGTTRSVEAVGPLIGMVGVGVAEPGDATIWGMWVAPDSRRRGIANRLLDAAELWAAASQAHTATLWVHRTNDEAKMVYERRGYALIGATDRPAEVSPECNDEICMRLRLELD
jgi:ribosomal protein S18 acetylase RimI-like enzyme